MDRVVEPATLRLPLVRIEPSQKAAKGVSLMDLARWLDERMGAARQERVQLCGTTVRKR